MSGNGARLADEHDCLLLDLDGTVYRGAEPIEGASGVLAGITAKALFVTNNASRAPREIALELRRMGFALSIDDIATSAQCAAQLLASRLEPHARVLVVGTVALAAEVEAVGLRPIRIGDDIADVAAVVQGHSPHTGWVHLAQAALLIRAGAYWVATNTDVTLPTERGLLPGNGSMVAALRAATDRAPVVAGKPEPVILTNTVMRGGFRAPLMVGDRLDTDIACANAAGVPSLLVCTGVGQPADLFDAPPQQRPTHLAADLRGLTLPSVSTRIAEQPSWWVEVERDVVTVAATGISGPDDGLGIARALAFSLWQASPARGRRIVAADEDARRALGAAGVAHDGASIRR